MKEHKDRYVCSVEVGPRDGLQNAQQLDSLATRVSLMTILRLW